MAAAVAVVAAGCATLATKPATPKLAPVESRTLDVTFLGWAPAVGQLHVCFMVTPAAQTCVEREYFERLVREGRGE